MAVADFRRVASVKHGATNITRVMFNGIQLWPSKTTTPTRGIVVPPNQAVVLIAWDGGTTGHSGTLRGRYSPLGGGFGNLNLSGGPGQSPIRFDLPAFTGEAVFQFIQDQGSSENTVDYKAKPGEVVVIHLDWSTSRGILNSNQIPYVVPGPDDSPFDYVLTRDDFDQVEIVGAKIHIEWDGNDKAHMRATVQLPGKPAVIPFTVSSVVTAADGTIQYRMQGPAGYDFSLWENPTTHAMWLPVAGMFTMSTNGGAPKRNVPIHGTPPTAVLSYYGVFVAEADCADTTEPLFLMQDIQGGQPSNSFDVKQLPPFLYPIILPADFATTKQGTTLDGTQLFWVMDYVPGVGYFSPRGWAETSTLRLEFSQRGANSSTNATLAVVHYGMVDGVTGMTDDRGVVQH
jgi:hypothetical protein